MADGYSEHELEEEENRKVFVDDEKKFYGMDLARMCQGGTFVPPRNTGDDEFLDLDENDEFEFDEEEIMGLAPVTELLEVKKDLNLLEAPDYSSLGYTMTNLTEDGGVMKLVLQKGTGKVIPKGCKVWFHYTSFLHGEQIPYDSTIIRKTTQSYLTSSSNLIVGLDIGIKSMEFLEAAQFLLTPKYAYGELGCKPRVPPDTPIVINVKILNILSEEKLKTVQFMTDEERSLLPFQEVLDASHSRKSAGNASYSSRDYRHAVREYRRGIHFLEEYSNVTQEEDAKRNECLSALFTNMAQTYLKLKKYPQACNACKNGLRCCVDAHFRKLYYRFSQAKFYLGNTKHALDLIRKSITQKNEGDIPQDILAFERKIAAQIDQERKAERLLYKTMAKGVFSQRDPKDQN